MLTKLFTREKSEYDRFVKVNREVTDLGLKEQLSGRTFRMMMGIFTQIGPLLIYFAGGWLIISETDPTLTVGTITASVALINRLYRPVESLLNIQVDWIRSMAMFTRIAMSTVPWYEIAISIAILVGSTVGVGFIAAKIYRVGVLLYGTTPKIGSIIKAVWKA